MIIYLVFFSFYIQPSRLAAWSYMYMRPNTWEDVSTCRKSLCSSSSLCLFDCLSQPLCGCCCCTLGKKFTLFCVQFMWICWRVNWFVPLFITAPPRVFTTLLPHHLWPSQSSIASAVHQLFPTYPDINLHHRHRHHHRSCSLYPSLTKYSANICLSS